MLELGCNLRPTSKIEKRHSLEVMPGLALVIMTMTMTKKGGRKSGLTFLVREIDFFWLGVVRSHDLVMTPRTRHKAMGLWLTTAKKRKKT